ncbi:MAG: hypothetical protein J7K15_10195 [Deltaproteobacteria bacterium]|nr:hypothetical protein [Deltaproteobacteria bacterium]
MGKGLQITSKVIVEVYTRDGKLRERREQPANLVLNNFLYLLRTLFGGVNKGQYAYVGSFTAEDGDVCQFMIGNAPGCWDFCSLAPKQYYVECGTDNTAPGPTDCKLYAKLAEGTADVTEVDLSASPPYIKIGGYIDIPSNATVWEIGLSLEAGTYVPTADTYEVNRILFFRDVLSDGLDVYAGDRIEVTYQINIQR